VDAFMLLVCCSYRSMCARLIKVKRMLASAKRSDELERINEAVQPCGRRIAADKSTSY
jgi:hypothetical protein